MYIHTQNICIIRNQPQLISELSTVRTVKWSVERKTSTAKQWPEGVNVTKPTERGEKNKNKKIKSVVLLKGLKNTKTLVTSPKMKTTAKPPLHRRIIEHCIKGY